MELLFASRLDVIRIEGHLHWHVRRPRVTEQPVLVGDTETDAKGVHIYGTVLNDGGVYRMWYQASPKGLPHDSPLVAYAESDDGVTWRKPALNLVEWNGSTNNNLCDLGMHGPSIVKLPQGGYLATGCIDARYVHHNPAATEAPIGGGYYIAHSDDGLHWTLDTPHPHPAFGVNHTADNIYTIHHPGRGCLQNVHKYTRPFNHIMRRTWVEMSCRNGQWSKPQQAIVPDEFDDIAAAARGYVSGDYNGISLMPANCATVGFIQMHRNRMPRKQHPCGRAQGTYGVLDLTLAWQLDEHARWMHAPGRPDFVTHASVDWARGMIFSGSGVETFGDEQRLYLSGSNHSHGVGAFEDGPGCAIGYAAWPKWQLCGYRADPDGEIDIELPDVTEPRTFELNHETEPGGHVAVSLHTLEPYQRQQEAKPLTEPAAAPITVTPQPGKRIIVRLHMYRATAYAFDLT